jgi:diaminohydroxyphosphoribosylaminopyrimidine deaminase / 5-amino-6-(5-phosphoribosylamino)uracil reductase
MTRDRTDRDATFMRRAIALAEAGWGRVHPNPMVGALVVRDEVVVGEGAHREFGGPHAEVAALRAAGDAARGATLYVTLEPCAHHGKTPPCTDVVLAAGIRRVVIAAEDPNPVAAGGAARLRDAGLEVTVGVQRDAARCQNALFLHPLERGTPFVALKYGLSLDGRIARAEGERTRITGAETEGEVHRLRAGFDAIMVGGRTARIDDPLLTARGAVTPRVPPVRVVVSTRADVPRGGRLLSSPGQAPVWLVTGANVQDAAVERLRDRGVRVLVVAPDTGGDGSLDPEAVVSALWAEGIRTILCEGGGRLGSALLEAGLVRRLYLFQAPFIFGERGVPAFPGRQLEFAGRVVALRRVGRDTLTIVERSD